DLAGVRVVRRTESLAKQALFGRCPEIQGREGHEKRPGKEKDVPRREAGAGEMQTEAGIDRVTHESIRPVAYQLVVAVDLELEVVVPAERRDRPDREDDAEHDQNEADPADRLGHVQLWPGTHRDNEVRNDEEVGDVVGEPARSRERLATPGHAADARDLRDDHEGNDPGDRHGGHQSRAHPTNTRGPRTWGSGGLLLRTRLARQCASHGWVNLHRLTR